MKESLGHPVLEEASLGIFLGKWSCSTNQTNFSKCRIFQGNRCSSIKSDKLALLPNSFCKSIEASTALPNKSGELCGSFSKLYIVPEKAVIGQFFGKSEGSLKKKLKRGVTSKLNSQHQSDLVRTHCA